MTAPDGCAETAAAPPSIRQRHLALGGRRRLARPHAKRRHVVPLQASIELPGEVDRPDGFDVPGNDQEHVLRRVEPPVIIQRILTAEASNLIPPSDDRLAVGMGREAGGLQRFTEDLAGIAFGAHQPLLEHDAAFGADPLLGENQVVHPVGLVFHAGGEMLGGNLLKIGGEVVRGEGVLLAAKLRDQGHERPGRMPACP